MNFKIYALIGLVGVSINTHATAPEEDFNAALSALFNSMKTNFSCLDDVEPSEVGQYKNSYANTHLAIPRMESSIFIEDQKSKQRVLEIEFDFDLSDADERQAFDDMQMEFYGLSSYWIKSYQYNEKDSLLMFFVKDRTNEHEFVGGFTIGIEKGRATMRIYPFDRPKFFKDLKKLIKTGMKTNFAACKGEKNALMKENEWMSTYALYQANWSVYSERFDLVEEKVYTHNTYYSQLPSQLLVQLFGNSKDITQRALRSDFTVTNFEKTDRGDNSFSIKIELASTEGEMIVLVDKTKLNIGTPLQGVSLIFKK